MENQTETTTATTTETKKTTKTSNVFAVMKNPETNEIITVKATTRTELGKILADNYPNFTVIQVFKGKTLSISEKKSFKFN